MTEEPKSDPRSRMRAMLGDAMEKNGSEKSASPLTRLPRKSVSPSFMPQGTGTNAVAQQARPVETDKPPRSEPVSAPISEPRPTRTDTPRKYSFGPPFWTITGILSLIVNAILIAIIIGLLLNYRNLQLGNVMNMPPTLLGGLYTNFEKMDRAHIKTSVDVSTNIPVKFDLLLNQQTNVVLSQDVRIDNARVSVHTGGLDITNALTTIILPAGQTLPINLSLTVPVDQQVPVTLNVPVDIALKDTDLHEPFTGLQGVVQPLYCMVSPQALNLDGQAVCKKAP